MNQVLYANYEFSEDDKKPELVSLLESENISADYINNHTVPGKTAENVFWENYYKKLADYEVLIAHLGTSFNSRILEVRDKYPHLNIVLTSSAKGRSKYHESTEKLLVCGHNPEIIIPFVKKSLERANKPKLKEEQVLDSIFKNKL